MPKIEYIIISLDGKGNLITHKNKCLKFMRRGEFYNIPLEKGEYNRHKIDRKLRKERKNNNEDLEI